MHQLLPFSSPPDISMRIKDRLKLIVGALVYPVQCRRWCRFMRHQATLHELAQRYPRIRHKIYRPYLCARLSCSERVDVLISHYRQLFDAGFAELIGQAAVHAVPLAEFSGKNESLFQLHLTAINDGHREGDLTLKLMHQRRCLYTASFALATLDGRRCVVLGALQGVRSEDGAEIVKRVTRELHGCRPKKLMVETVRAFGAYLGCNHIVLVSNNSRIAVNGRRARRISSNYDETWAEMGASLRDDGNYELQCVEPAQNLDLLPSKKRAEARRRIALLGSVCLTLTANLEARRQRAPRLELPFRSGVQAGASLVRAPHYFDPG